MVSYALLGLLMLKRHRGARAGSGGTGRNGGANVADAGETPAFRNGCCSIRPQFLLTAGIFTGAVWAQCVMGTLLGMGSQRSLGR